MNDCGAEIWPKLQQMQKKVKDGLFDENIDHAKKKLKIALLNKTVFKVKFKFKVEDCVMQISVHHFLGWNVWHNSLSLFLSFCSEIEKENLNLLAPSGALIAIPTY